MQTTYQLVSTKTDDGLKLSGLFAEGDKDKPVVIHIHGFEGDFFTHTFINPMAKILSEQGFSFLTVQTRGLGNEFLFKTAAGWKKFGSHFELLEEAFQDINGWISFLLNAGYSRVVLQGHSMGTIKVLRYLFEGAYVDQVEKVSLLAPFDIMQLLEDATKGKWPEYLKLAEEMVSAGRGEEIIPKEFLDVEVSYQTYVSHHGDNEFQKMFAFHNNEYSFPLLAKVKKPVHVFVGDEDPYFHPANPENPGEAVSILKKHLRASEVTLFKGAGHSFDGFEDDLAARLVEFVATSA